MEIGIELIAQERKEQLEKHGYTPHEDASRYGSPALIRAACLMAYDDAPKDMPVGFAAPDWAWLLRVKNINNIIKRLTIAGALIAAEIDRLSHIEKHHENETTDN